MSRPRLSKSTLLPRGSLHLRVLVLLALSTSSLAGVLPSQNNKSPPTICTCSSSERSISRTSQICRLAGGSEALISVFLPPPPPDEDGFPWNAGIPGVSSWNECYVPDEDKAYMAFSDENCKERFGEDFTGDCVPYPGDPGLADVPRGPEFYCKKGVEAFPDCPIQDSLSGCNSPFSSPRCCSQITQLCVTP